MEPHNENGDQKKGEAEDREANSWLEDDLSVYAGRWVARLGGRIVGQGGTPDQALLAAKTSRFKEAPQITYVPTTNPFVFSPILERVCAVLPQDLTVYLVGGAVRDALMGLPNHDLDFVLAAGGLSTARRAADALQAAFYPLDAGRDTGRVILTGPDGSRIILDFSIFRGDDLETDLRNRDFTVNAMAVNIRSPQALLDPLGGAVDLQTRKLRACSANSFRDDPLRLLRGIRLAGAFNMRIIPETLGWMRTAVPGLQNVSPERLRDELVRILGGPQPATCMRALEMIGVFPYLLPELSRLKGLEQSSPHIADAWTHTLGVLQSLENLLDILSPVYDQDKAASLLAGLVALRLGRYREQLVKHLDQALNPDRSHRSLLFFAALYHDAGKPDTQKVDEDGRIRFFDHDKVGAKLAKKRARALHFSNDEVEWVGVIVAHHLRPLLLAQTGKPPTKRAIYRFFRDTGPAGIDICLLSMADVWATYSHTLPQGVWGEHLDIVRALLEAWWERHNEDVSPRVSINGSELMDALGIEEGPLVGEILEDIREAQAEGLVGSREEALELARTIHGRLANRRENHQPDEE